MMSDTFTPWRQQPRPTEVAGRVLEVPHLAEAPLREKEAFLRDFVSYGTPAEGPVTAFADEPEPEPAPPSIFDPAALLAPLPGRSERFTMPNGQVVWVHPASLQDAARANRLALAEVKKLGLVVDGKLDEAEIEARMRGLIYQAIYVCRTGPELTAPHVFKEAHAEALRRNPGYVDAVQQICALSDRLSAGKSEADLLREGFADFFGAIEKALASFSGDETNNSSPAWKQKWEDLTNCVSALRQPSGYSPSDLQRAARRVDSLCRR